MTNLEYLKDRKRIDDERKQIDSLPKQVSEWEIEYRRTKALEIIAEELIKHNETSGCIVTTLENIDTTLNRR